MKTSAFALCLQVPFFIEQKGTYICVIQLWTPGYGGDSDRMILYSFRNGQFPLKINDLRLLCQCKSLSVNML